MSDSFSFQTIYFHSNFSDFLYSKIAHLNILSTVWLPWKPQIGWVQTEEDVIQTTAAVIYLQPNLEYTNTDEYFLLSFIQVHPHSNLFKIIHTNSIQFPASEAGFDFYTFNYYTNQPCRVYRKFRTNDMHRHFRRALTEAQCVKCLVSTVTLSHEKY